MSPDMAQIETETFGQRVVRLRKKKGLRQIDLAANARISWRHLIRIEQDAGGVTKEATVARIADALGVTVDELAGAEEDDEESDPVAALTYAIKRLVQAEVRAL
jgi:transcriptional regulator with XRE-family HTH domain